MIDFAQIASTSEHAARLAGAVLLDWQGRVKVRAKAPADLVTEADYAAQECIRRVVADAYPDHGFLAEESTSDERAASLDAEIRWIVDPLDGTTNFVHGLPYYCVSVAVEQAGQIIAGTIYDPIHDNCFRATKGQGAFHNDQPISVSNVDKLADSLVVTGFGPLPRADSLEVRRFVQVLGKCHAARRMGASALNMCYLAAGHFDAYWGSTVKAWDVAAGVLIIREAGGVVTAVDGGPFDLAQPNLLTAATPKLHAEVLGCFAQLT